MLFCLAEAIPLLIPRNHRLQTVSHIAFPFSSSSLSQDSCDRQTPDTDVDWNISSQTNKSMPDRPCGRTDRNSPTCHSRHSCSAIVKPKEGMAKKNL
mmetsp:Transcript_48549/g.152271  ORF Transcript_48549/g.152271 Transcript_48549/m.152271 type:complete len:97 (-) Transcript_48549:442-732(-)